MNIDSDTFVCREGHYHDGPVRGKAGTDGQMCPEEMVGRFITGGMSQDAAVDKVYGDTCQWFALCDHPAEGYMDHPVLGHVPCCERCATHVGATLRKENA